MDMNLQWRKATYSSSNGGNCIEVATADRTVAVRDSKNPNGPRLAFGVHTWQAFAAKVKGERSLAFSSTSTCHRGALILGSAPCFLAGQRCQIWYPASILSRPPRTRGPMWSLVKPPDVATTERCGRVRQLFAV